MPRNVICHSRDRSTRMPKNKSKPAAGGASLMEKLAQMQSEMKRVQEELAEERYTISVGGDAVQVVIDGQQRVHHVIFSAEALAAGQQDREMLQDLVVAAVNNALEHS